MPNYFGIRHLSPNGAFNIRRKLDELKPKVVLIESPSDFTSFIPEFSNKEVKPPFAILAFTSEKPIKTVIVPFAIYSPEYQAVLWCNENKVECRFIDLPSDIVIGLELSLDEKIKELDSKDKDDKSIDGGVKYNFKYRSIYDLLEKKYGSHETFWEANIEHTNNQDDNYFEAVNSYGAELRSVDYLNNLSNSNNNKNNFDFANNYIRESYMKAQILEVLDNNKKISEEDIVILTGAFHTEGLKLDNKGVTPMTKKELASLNKLVKANKTVTQKTLMPYSYFKLSKQAGYGAGNNAPNYYHMLWNAINNSDLDSIGIEYLTSIAREMREEGHNASSAQVIDAVKLSKSLAYLNNREYPTLLDLQDACLTCFGEGELGSIAKARTITEIGTTIGYLPDGMSNTSIQQDFNNNIDDLKLRTYTTITTNEVSLDLRENIHVKSEKSAFLDLNRSFFLHRLKTLGVHFCSQILHSQDSASFREKWNLQWSTEVEIELVESSLLGDTIERASIQFMRNSIEEDTSISNISKQILNSFLCGLPEALSEFIVIFQMETIESKDFIGFANCIDNLMNIINYGNLRKMSKSNLESTINMLETLYQKVILMLDDNLSCDDSQVKAMIKAIDIIDKLTIDFDSIDNKQWLSILDNITDNLNINQFLAGYSTALLLEKGFYTPEDVEKKIIFHLSSSIDGKITANWLEGFCMKNRYQLILNLNIWKYLDKYISGLGEEDFKRVVLFLRRAFTKFSSSEKDSIVDNLKELWGVNIANSEINTTITKQELEVFKNLASIIDDEYDFDNI